MLSPLLLLPSSPSVSLSFVTVSRSLFRAEQLKRPQVDEKERERVEGKGQLRVAIACSAHSETDHAGQREEGDCRSTVFEVFIS